MLLRCIKTLIIPTDVDRAGVCADVDRGACRCRETEGGRGGRGAGRRGSQVGVGEQRPHPRAVAEPAAAAQQAQEEAQETGGEGGEERTQGERAQRRTRCTLLGGRLESYYNSPKRSN